MNLSEGLIHGISKNLNMKTRIALNPDKLVGNALTVAVLFGMEKEDGLEISYHVLRTCYRRMKNGRN